MIFLKYFVGVRYFRKQFQDTIYSNQQIVFIYILTNRLYHLCTFLLRPCFAFLFRKLFFILYKWKTKIIYIKQMKESGRTQPSSFFRKITNNNSQQIFQLHKTLQKQKIDKGYFTRNISNLITTGRRQKTEASQFQSTIPFTTLTQNQTNPSNIPLLLQSKYQMNKNMKKYQIEDIITKGIEVIQNISDINSYKKNLVGERKKYISMMNWLKNCLGNLQNLSKQNKLTKQNLFEYLQNIYSSCIVDVIKTVKIQSKEKGSILQIAWQNIVKMLSWIYNYYNSLLQQESNKYLIKSDGELKKYMAIIDQLKKKIEIETKLRQKKQLYFYDVVKDNRILRRRNRKLLLRLKYQIEGNIYLKEQNLNFYKQNEKMKMVLSQENLVEQFLNFKKKINRIQRDLSNRKKITKNNLTKEINQNQIIKKLGIESQIDLIIKRIDEEDLLDLQYYEVPDPQSLKKLYYNCAIQTQPMIQSRGTNTSIIPIKLSKDNILQTQIHILKKYIINSNVVNIKIQKLGKKSLNSNTFKRNVSNISNSRKNIQINPNKSRSSNKYIQQNLTYEAKLQKYQGMFIDIIQTIQNLKDLYNTCSLSDKTKIRKDNQIQNIKIQKQFKDFVPFRHIFQANQNDDKIISRVSRPSRNFDQFNLMISRRRNTTTSSQDSRKAPQILLIEKKKNNIMGGAISIAPKNIINNKQKSNIGQKKNDHDKINNRKNGQKKIVAFANQDKDTKQSNQFLRLSLRRQEILSKTKKLLAGKKQNQKYHYGSQNSDQKQMSPKNMKKKKNYKGKRNNYINFMYDDQIMSNSNSSGNELQTIQQIITKKSIKSQNCKTQINQDLEQNQISIMNIQQNKKQLEQQKCSNKEADPIIEDKPKITKIFKNKQQVVTFFKNAISQNNNLNKQQGKKKSDKSHKNSIKNQVKIIKKQQQQKKQLIDTFRHNQLLNKQLKVGIKKNGNSNLQELIQHLTALFPLNSAEILNQQKKYFSVKAIRRILTFINRSIIKDKDHLLNGKFTLKKYLQLKMQNMYGFDQISGSVIKKIIKSLKKHQQNLFECKTMMKLLGNFNDNKLKQNQYLLHDIFKIYILLIEYSSMFDQKVKICYIPKAQMIDYVKAILQIYFSQQKIRQFIDNLDQQQNQNKDINLNIYKVFNQITQLILQQSYIPQFYYFLFQLRPQFSKKQIISIEQILRMVQLFERNQLILNQNMIKLFFYCSFQQNGKRVIPIYKFCLFAKKFKWQSIINMEQYIKSNYTKFYDINQQFHEINVMLNWSGEFQLFKNIFTLPVETQILQIINQKITKYIFNQKNNTNVTVLFPEFLYKMLKLWVINKISNKQLYNYVHSNVQIFSTCLIAHVLKKQFDFSV